MNKRTTIHLTLLSICFLWLSYLPVKAQTMKDTSSQTFLTWYEEHKDDRRATYTLQQDIHLDSGRLEQPIMLDGKGNIDIDCDMYSIYIESNVIIDNKNLYIMGDWRSSSSTVVIQNTPTSQANLQLKNGGIYSSVIGLDILSGELQSPKGNDRFTIIGGSNSTPALNISTQFQALRNLDVHAVENHQTIAVLAQGDIQLENCTIEVGNKIEHTDTTNTIAVQAGNRMDVVTSQINAYGNHAQSLVSEAGNTQIHVDEYSTLSPKLSVEPTQEPTYRLLEIQPMRTMVIPIHMENLLMPTHLQVRLGKWHDATQQLPYDLQVDWDDKQVQACMQTYGECKITGTFSSSQILTENIYVPNSFQPTIKIKVVPPTAMNKIQIAQIETKAIHPFIEMQILQPYGANQMYIEYSKDGIVWQRGTCTSTLEQQSTDNVLRCGDRTSPYLLTSLFYPSLSPDGYIRAIVHGGPFDGMNEAVRLDPNNLFTRPGEDGGGGNRGGSGQWEGERNHDDEEEEPSSTDLPNPSYPIENDVIAKTGSKNHSLDIRLFPCILLGYLVLTMKKNDHVQI